MPSEGTGSYGRAMDPGAAQFARLEHFASVIGGDPAAVPLDDAALAMAAVLRARPTEAAHAVLDELAAGCAEPIARRPAPVPLRRARVRR